MVKLCECGCGQPTRIATRTNRTYGHTVGQPVKFVKGHNFNRVGERENGRKKYTNAQGYVMVYQPDHPNVNCQGYVREHTIVVERALGKVLRTTANVHHVDGDPANNDPRNLVVCDGMAYHKLLHMRARAKAATGDPSAVHCAFCGVWGDGGSMSRFNHGYRHKSCHARWMREHNKQKGGFHDRQGMEILLSGE